jgi:hypothetical protein
MVEERIKIGELLRKLQLGTTDDRFDALLGLSIKSKPSRGESPLWRKYVDISPQL